MVTTITELKNVNKEMDTQTTCHIGILVTYFVQITNDNEEENTERNLRNWNVRHMATFNILKYSNGYPKQFDFLCNKHSLEC
jgi:hypothetical protein